jgi:hypothetical protein
LKLNIKVTWEYGTVVVLIADRYQSLHVELAVPLLCMMAQQSHASGCA